MNSDERKQRFVVRGHEFRLVQVELENCVGYTDGDAQDKVDSWVWGSKDSYGVEVELAEISLPSAPGFAYAK